MFRSVALLALTSVALISARAISPAGQEVFQAPSTTTTEYFHSSSQNSSNLLDANRQFDFAEWCKDSKARFLDALKNGGANEWVIVLGNEAADTDSMVSSLATAYHLARRKVNPEKAVALLQVTRQALTYRPENQLIMKQAHMASIPKELLTLDQLTWPPGKLSQMIKGIVLVDHNRPLSYWRNVPLLGLIDHHEDRGLNLTAYPRIIEPTASTASLVAQLILHEEHKAGTIPEALADLLFTAISNDTKGLKKKKTTKRDADSAKRIFPYTSYHKDDMKETAKKLAKAMKSAEKDVHHLNVTQLYARDYKGDVMYNSTVPVNVGYANVPFVISDLIEKSCNKTREGLAKESRDWITQNEIDVLLILTKGKNHKNEKIREVILLAKHGYRLTEEQAERVYHKIRDCLEKDDTLKLRSWHDEKDWGHQRYAWKQGGAGEGRKTIRPIVEKAIQEW